MKKILTIFICFIMCVTTAYAKNKNDNYTLKFNGDKYTLLFSAKDKETNGYLNEYFKQRETYNTWSEMVAVHHFPNAYSPIDQVKMFREYLGSLNCPSALTFDDKKNTAMIDFIMISEHRVPVVLEFNVFKFQKSKECGSVALQYAKRYTATTAFEVEAVKKQFEKERKILIAKVKNTKLPDVVLKDIDKCKFETVETTQDENKSENYIVTPPKAEELEEAPSDEVKETVQDTEIKNEEIKSVQETQEQKEESNEIIENKAVIEETNEKDATENSKKETTLDETAIDTKQSIDEDKNEIKTKNKNKKAKEESYQVVNSKDEYIAKPRTSKDLKAKNKKKKKEASYKVINSKDDYIAKPRTKRELKEINKQIKKERKINAKKAAKERVKKASKKLKGD